MANGLLDETPEISRKGKRKSDESWMDYIPDWIPGVSELKEQKKRIQGESQKKIKKETPWGEYQ